MSRYTSRKHLLSPSTGWKYRASGSGRSGSGVEKRLGDVEVQLLQGVVLSFRISEHSGFGSVFRGERLSRRHQGFFKVYCFRV